MRFLAFYSVGRRCFWCKCKLDDSNKYCIGVPFDNALFSTVSPFRRTLPVHTEAAFRLLQVPYQVTQFLHFTGNPLAHDRAE